MHSRRKVLLTSASIAAISGCASEGGNSNEQSTEQENETEEENSEQDSTQENNEPEAESADGVVGEPIQKGPITVTFEKVSEGDALSIDGVVDREAAKNSKYIGYEVTIEATGEETLEDLSSNEFSASYLGHSATLRTDEGNSMEVAGSSFPTWPEIATNGGAELSSGDSISGGVVANVPTVEYQPADLLLSYSHNETGTTIKARGGEGTPRIYSAQSPSSGTYSFGDDISDGGIMYTVNEYTLADELVTPQRTVTSADDSQFMIVQFLLRNVSPIAQDVFSRPTVNYAGSEAEAAGVALRLFQTGDGEDAFFGLFATAATRGDNKVVGGRFYPEVAIASALAYEVPTDFDESEVEVVMPTGIGVDAGSEEVIFNP